MTRDRLPGFPEDSAPPGPVLSRSRSRYTKIKEMYLGSFYRTAKLTVCILSQTKDPTYTLRTRVPLQGLHPESNRNRHSQGADPRQPRVLPLDLVAAGHG